MRDSTWCIRWLQAGLALGAVACGRPATEAECEEIVARIARLQIEAEQRTRPETVAAEVDEFQTRVRERTRHACVGKPITERSLTCARSAATPAAVEACFF